MSTATDDIWDNDAEVDYWPEVVEVEAINFSRLELETIHNITTQAYKNCSTSSTILSSIHNNLSKFMAGRWSCMYSYAEYTTHFSNGSDEAVVVYKVDFSSWVLIHHIKDIQKEMLCPAERNDQQTTKINNSAWGTSVNLYLLILCTLLMIMNSCLLVFAIIRTNL
ncbi:hypothetical protein Ddc_12092 [Ditylenchus destructor]|nr:hypothetical protein Ddc_12092 [Ditylenchus destructor]